MQILASILFILVALVPFSAYSFFIPKAPLALSLSGSGRALAEKGAEYHLLNPAVIIHTKGHLRSESFYVFETEHSSSYWGVSLMENSQFPLALSYIREWNGENQYIVMSTASSLVPGLSLGLSVSRATNPQDSYWNIQTGLLMKNPRSPFSIGITWDHVLPEEGVYKDQERFGMGLAYNFRNWLEAVVDTVYNRETQWESMGGVEITLNKFLVLRGAGSWQFKEEMFKVSGGLGFKTEQLSLDYSLSQGEKETWIHALSARLNL